MNQRSLNRVLLVVCSCVVWTCVGCATQTGIAASPSEIFVEVGGSKVVNVVTVTDLGGSAPVTDPLTITSADESVATVDEGNVMGVAEGTTELTITDGTFTTTATVNVVPAGTLPTRLVVTPTSIECTPESDDIQLAPFAVLTSGTSIDITDDAIYGSNNSTVALVTLEGTVVCVSPGEAQIAVQYLGLAILVDVSVAPVPPASVTFTPVELRCAIGETPTVQISATSDDGLVDDVTDTAEVQTDSPTVATFANGVIQCLTEGTARITATINGITAQLPVDVVERLADPDELVSIQADPQAVSCAVTEVAPFSVVGELGDGSTVNVSGDPLIVYQSSDTDVVLILDDEPVCVQAGQADVTITLGGLQATAMVTVQ